MFVCLTWLAEFCWLCIGLLVLNVELLNSVACLIVWFIVCRFGFLHALLRDLLRCLFVGLG